MSHLSPDATRVLEALRAGHPWPTWLGCVDENAFWWAIAELEAARIVWTYVSPSGKKFFGLGPVAPL